MRHFRSIAEAGPTTINRLLDLTAHMAEVNRRPNPNVPALRGRTICNVFFEDSTRTRLSFETAEKRLSAGTMNFSVSSSSVNKGESLRDTIETIGAMGVDAFVIRHRSSGTPWQIAQWTDGLIVNAGDGWANHPTQALLDCFTIRQAFNCNHAGRTDFSGLKIGIVGDIKHSRVARSNIEAFTMLGAEVTLIAPGTLLPPAASSLPVTISSTLDDVLADLDVLYLLRMQQERMNEALVPSLREYTARYGLTAARAKGLKPDTIVMHPGPMNRGVEIVVDPADLPGERILQQVTNGISVRMAVLFDIFQTDVQTSDTSDTSDTRDNSVKPLLAETRNQ